MNLKEAFRYQNFLEQQMYNASSSISSKDHCLKLTRTHLRSKANPDAADVIEEVAVEEFFPNDQVIAFMQWLVDERQTLTEAIGKAKASLSFDLDAAIETNKFRQKLGGAIKSMFRHAASKKVEQGRDYKFNNEGNQTMYYYDIETEAVEAYDKFESKNLMRSIITMADKVSSEIDSALINTTVEYEPVFDVNDDFDDIMERFAAEILNK
jgi:hypothetical protein